MRFVDTGLVLGLASFIVGRFWLGEKLWRWLKGGAR